MAAAGIQRPASASGTYPFHSGFLPSPSPAVSPCKQHELQSYARTNDAAYSRPSSAASQHDTFNGYRKSPVAHSHTFTSINTVNHHRPQAGRHSTSTQHINQRVVSTGEERPAVGNISPAQQLVSSAIELPPPSTLQRQHSRQSSRASSRTQIEPAPPAEDPEPGKWETDILVHEEPDLDTQSHERPRTPPPMRADTPVPDTFDREKPSLKNRLRRALSFSSSSNLADLADPDRSPARRTLFGRAVNRSTDNLSVTSTASSASIMLRKMSNNIGKRTRQTFSGIFNGAGRKRVDTPDPFSARPVRAGVSYVHAESLDEDMSRPSPDDLARQMSSEDTGPQSTLKRHGRRAVPAVTSAQENVDGHGSIEFPRLSQEIDERDVPRRGSMHLDRALPAEQQQVQAALAHGRNDSQISVQPMPTDLPLLPPVTTKKPQRGILKRTTRFPLDDRETKTVIAPAAVKPPGQASIPMGFDFEQELRSLSEPMLLLDFDLNAQSKATESAPVLSAPAAASSTPTLVAPESQNPSPPARSMPQQLTFSPRIVIHDTYHATEYDRRGDIATCNRLTPLLAQRIKEELNSFKMDEMDVAEDSRIYTHFFT